jgi:hypothetical protein
VSRCLPANFVTNIYDIFLFYKNMALFLQSSPPCFLYTPSPFTSFYGLLINNKKRRSYSLLSVQYGTFLIRLDISYVCASRIIRTTMRFHVHRSENTIIECIGIRSPKRFVAVAYLLTLFYFNADMPCSFLYMPYSSTHRKAT